jgi:hypothetical protein
MSMSAGEASEAIKQALSQHFGKGNVSIQNVRGAGCRLTFNPAYAG